MENKLNLETLLLQPACPVTAQVGRYVTLAVSTKLIFRNYKILPGCKLGRSPPCVVKAQKIPREPLP